MKLFKCCLSLLPLMGLASCVSCSPSVTVPEVKPEPKDIWFVLSVSDESKYKEAESFLKSVEPNDKNLKQNTSIIKVGNRHEIMTACEKMRTIRHVPNEVLNKEQVNTVVGLDIYKKLYEHSEDSKCKKVGIKHSLEFTVNKINSYITDNFPKTGNTSTVNRKLYIFLQTGLGELSNEDRTKLSEQVGKISLPKNLSLSLSIFNNQEMTYLDEIFRPWKGSYSKIIGGSNELQNHLQAFSQSKMN
jgi:hypothetical protein